MTEIRLNKPVLLLVGTLVLVWLGMLLLGTGDLDRAVLNEIYGGHRPALADAASRFQHQLHGLHEVTPDSTFCQFGVTEKRPSVMPSLVGDSKRFDFHEMLRARKASHFNRRAGRNGVPEVPETNVGVLEILVDIGDVRRRATDIVQRSTD